jgi:hypothetical protein
MARAAFCGASEKILPFFSENIYCRYVLWSRVKQGAGLLALLSSIEPSNPVTLYINTFFSVYRTVY